MQKKSPSRGLGGRGWGFIFGTATQQSTHATSRPGYNLLSLGLRPRRQNGHSVSQRRRIVVLILWSRLGTPLPIKTERREYIGLDGRSPVTGTEWEFEDAW